LLFGARLAGLREVKGISPDEQREFPLSFLETRGVRSMKGVIWHIYRNQQKGMIRGDDGVQITFRKSALNGVDFYALSSGQRVCYRVEDSWLGKEAVEVRPLLVEKAAENV
jgi:cold shock CspA family protein